MNDLFYILPLIFGVMGWATEHLELYAMGGALSFYTAYTIISEGNPITNTEVFLVIVYTMLTVSLLLRIITSVGGEK